MCFPCLAIFSSLPLLWVVALPVVGAFCGPETVLRISLLMMMYSAIESVVQRFLKAALPIFSIAFFVVIICLPVNVIPYPFVWMYGHIVWITEPILLLVEALGIVELTILLSKKVSHYVEDEDNTILAKATILGTAVICYSSSFLLAVYIYWMGSSAIRWLLLAVILISLVHLALTVWLDQGIVSNCAVVAVCMLGALCIGLYETDLVKHPLSEPMEWSDESTDLNSLIQMLLSAATTSLSHMSKATRFLYKLISPVLISLIIVRAISMLQIVYWLLGRLKEYITYDEDNLLEDDDYLEEVEIDECTCVPSICAGYSPTPLPAKLALIFVYTQLVYRTMSLSGGHAPFKAYVPPVLHGLLDGKWVLQDVGFLRLSQLSVLSVFYPLRLFGEGGESD